MEWRQITENGRVSWVCVHGVHHPDRKSVAVQCNFEESVIDRLTAHACDGCCQRDDFPGRINIQNFKTVAEE